MIYLHYDKHAQFPSYTALYCDTSKVRSYRINNNKIQEFISVPTANVIASSTVGASTPVYMLHVTLANYNIYQC